MPPPVEGIGRGQTPTQRKGGRAIVRPACFGSVLLVMYIAFVSLVSMNFEDSTGRDSGAAYHLRKSTSRAMTVSSNGQAGSLSGKNENDEGRRALPTPAPVGASKPLTNEPSATVERPGRAENEHPDHVDFCGECLWKDSWSTCNERVAYEVKEGRYSEHEAKKANLVHCMRPTGNLSDFCGACRWKHTHFTCDERVAYESEKHHLSAIQVKWRNMAHCTGSPSNESSAIVERHGPSELTSELVHPDLVDFCGECLWKDTDITCNKRVAWEVTQGRAFSMYESKKKNLLHCQRPAGMHLSDFCGACRWKDTDFTCDERVAFEAQRDGFSTVEATWRNLPHCKYPPYALSPVCGGCVRSSTDAASVNTSDGASCHKVILQRIEAGSTAMAAAGAVGREFERCRRCDPATCWREYFGKASSDASESEKAGQSYLTKYWRFDRAAPNITYPTTVTLLSIPEQFRFPPSRPQDLKGFLMGKYRAFEASNDTYVKILAEYNPSLAPIPPKMKKHLPKYATYALALRVTPANGCFQRETMSGLPQKVWDHTMASPANLLGIALLDEEYEILPGYDIVVDIATQLGLQRDGYGTAHLGEPAFAYYRLSALNGKIFLHAGADVPVVTQLDLRSGTHSKPLEGFKLDAVYGEDRLEVTMLHQFNAFWSGGGEGGDFALFSVPNSTHPHAPNLIYAEVEIDPVHRVQQIHPNQYNRISKNLAESRISRNHAMDTIMRRKVATGGNLTESRGIEPEPGFFTVDEHWFPGKRIFRNSGRGGACCISLSRSEALAGGGHASLVRDTWGDNDHLLVGAANAVVDEEVSDGEGGSIPRGQHVSFFYAFDPRPPFGLRARSGYFCLGFAGDEGVEGGRANPHSFLAVDRMLSLNKETFRCPRIHLLSSFVEKVGDPSGAVIGYSINDCTSRIVEVSKAEIAGMMFSDPWDRKIEREPSDYDRAVAEQLDRMKSVPLN